MNNNNTLIIKFNTNNFDIRYVKAINIDFNIYSLAAHMNETNIIKTGYHSKQLERFLEQIINKQKLHDQTFKGFLIK